MRLVVALALLFGAGLSAQVSSKVDLVGPKLPAREKKCEIEFFENQPPEAPHQVVGHIRVYVLRNKLLSRSESQVESTRPEFQKQACRMGADAVVLTQQTTSGSNEHQTLYVKGDAIHLTGTAH